MVAHHTYIPNSTRQANPDYMLEFKLKSLIQKYFDGKHGIPKVENNSTITQVYINQNNNFQGILNPIMPADTYTKLLSANLFKLKSNINSKEDFINGLIDEKQEMLISKTISPELKINTYKSP